MIITQPLSAVMKIKHFILVFNHFIFVFNKIKSHTFIETHRYFFFKNEMFIIQTDYVEINKLTNCKIMSFNCFLHIYKVSWSIRK